MDIIAAVVKILGELFTARGLEGLFLASGWFMAVTLPIAVHLIHRHYSNRDHQMYKDHIQQLEGRCQSLVAQIEKNQEGWRDVVAQSDQVMATAIKEASVTIAIMTERLGTLQQLLLSVLQK